MGRLETDLETDRCKKQEAKGEACRPVCFRGSRTASSDGTGVLQPALTLLLSQLFLLFHPTLVTVLGG